MSPRCRPLWITCLAVAVLAPLALFPTGAAAQTPLPDYGVNLLQPSLLGNPKNPPRFRRRNESASPQYQEPPTGLFAAPSRIGAKPVYGSPPGLGAGTTGYDSTNRAGRRKLAQQPVPAAPGQAQPDTTFTPIPTYTTPPPPKRRPPPPPPPPEVHPLKAASRPGAVLPAPPETLPVSNPPPQIYPHPAATRPGAALAIPPPADFAPSAETPPPGMPPINTMPLGMQPQRPLPLAVGDPYAPLGLRAGSFLLYPAVELSAGYNTNPQNAPNGPPSSLFVVAPELRLQSDWARHSLTATINGSYTAYGATQTPSLNRPYFSSTIDGRIDVLRNTQILLENRVLVSTDNPGSPNLQAGLARLPIYTTVGGTLGVAQTFNRLQVTVKGTFDRSTYDNSVLTDGEVTSNADRDFNQYGGILRIAYELGPGFKPFVELDADQRIHDEQFDRNGLQRDSTGRSARAGGDLDLFGSLTGEFAVGYNERTYKDPTLPQIGGLIADGSLIWQASALTTAKFTAASTITESILPGSSGAFSRDFNLQVDHAFLLWIIGTLQIGYGRDDYVGLDRLDNRYFVSTGITYKLSRDLQFKATLRQDWLTSTASGVAYDATSLLLGLRLQR